MCVRLAQDAHILARSKAADYEHDGALERPGRAGANLPSLPLRNSPVTHHICAAVGIGNYDYAGLF